MDLLKDLLGDEVALRDVPVVGVLVNLVLVLILGQLLAWHYREFAKVLSNKRKFARLMVFISATTMLVITVVKTSLALSLGLVGALSIIRFRTPIKEPEELAYLFLSVALGVGLGADQRVATVLMFVAILAYLAYTAGRADDPWPRTLVHVTAEVEGEAETEGVVGRLLEAVSSGSDTVDVRRIDSHGKQLDVHLLVDLPGGRSVGPLLSRVRGVLPTAGVSVVESSSLD